MFFFFCVIYCFVFLLYTVQICSFSLCRLKSRIQENKRVVNKNENVAEDTAISFQESFFGSLFRFGGLHFLVSSDSALVFPQIHRLHARGEATGILVSRHQPRTPLRGRSHLIRKRDGYHLQRCPVVVVS